MRNVLFFSHNALALLHLGIELELADQYLSSGYHLHLLHCDGALESCYFNATHNLFGCAICKATRENGYKLLGKGKITTHQLKRKDQLKNIPIFKNLNELLDFKYKNVNIGRGAASSYISMLKNYEIQAQDDDKQALVTSLLRSGANVTDNVLDLCDRYNFDEFVLFNGRFSEVFPAVEIAQMNDIPFKTHERGATTKLMQVSLNSLPHSISYRTKLMLKMWAEADQNKFDVARNWLDGQSLAKDGSENKFTRNIAKGMLPETFDPTKTNVAIYNSSEHETKVIREWQFPAYSHQNEALLRIFEYYRERDDVHFYLRVHPHLTHVSNIQVSQLYAIDYPNVTVIRADSPVDSYALAAKMDKIISFGSTIGIESAYMGQVSILFGRSLYENLGVCYTPKSYEELYGLIDNTQLEAIESDNILVYAFYRKTYGEPMTKFEYVDKKEAIYNGHKIRRINLKAPFNILKNITHVTLWNRLNIILLGKKLSISNMLKLKTHLDKKL